MKIANLNINYLYFDFYNEQINRINSLIKSMYIVVSFLSHGTHFLFRVFHGIRKAEVILMTGSHWIAPGTANPLGGVEFGWQIVWNGSWNLVFKRVICWREHQFKQHFVSLLVFKQFNNLWSVHLWFQSIIVLSISPVNTDTFTNDTWRIFFFRQWPELAKYKLRNSF